MSHIRFKKHQPPVHVVDGGYEDAVKQSKEGIQHLGLYNANPGACNAKILGNSHIGVEIAEKIDPTYAICPTNNGTHLIGVHRGLKNTGPNPIMVGVVCKETIHRKAYSYERKDVGRPGKGPKVISIKRGKLSRFGYSTAKSDRARHAALKRAIKPTEL